MRIFSLELNNDIKGIEQRKQYIESLIATLPQPDFVILPELALCSYMASQEIWQYADSMSSDTSAWAMKIAAKYNTFIGTGYLDKENGDYYNRYLIADRNHICGIVTKCEGESAVFKRGDFGSIISTPFGNIAVAICYDSKRKHFYNNIKDEEVSLILFPHGFPADPKNPKAEIKTNDYLCQSYEDAFNVPVIYVNSVGKLPYMPGKMGALMKKNGFTMNGRSKIYAKNANKINSKVKEALGVEVGIEPKRRIKELRFHGEDFIKGNLLFRVFILKPDTQKGIALYNERR